MHMKMNLCSKRSYLNRFNKATDKIRCTLNHEIFSETHYADLKKKKYEINNLLLEFKRVICQPNKLSCLLSQTLQSKSSMCSFIKILTERYAFNLNFYLERNT